MNRRCTLLAAMMLVQLLASGPACGGFSLRQLFGGEKQPAAQAPAPPAQEAPAQVAPAEASPAETPAPAAPEPAAAKPAAPSPAPVRSPLLSPRPSRFSGQPSATCREQTLTEDTVWSGDVLVEGTVTVASQATLTVEPGARVRFRPGRTGNGTLLVRGRLQASGSAGQPVLFTSDGEGAAAGDWQGIVLLGSEKKNLLEHVRIEWAETAVQGLFSEVTVRNGRFYGCETALRMISSMVRAEDAAVSGCTSGFVLEDSEAELERVKLSGGSRGVRAISTSLYLGESSFTGIENALHAEESRLVLHRNSFRQNGEGLLIDSCSGEMSGNRISAGEGDGVVVDDSPLRFSGNAVTGNGGHGLLVRSGAFAPFDNSFSGNRAADVSNRGETPLAAAANWWGTPDAAEVARKVSGPVEFLPLLTRSPAP